MRPNPNPNPDPNPNPNPNPNQAVYKKYAREACRNVSCIEPVCASQLELAPPKAAPPLVVVLRENLYSAPLVSAPRTTRYGPKSAARRWAGAIVVVE